VIAALNAQDPAAAAEFNSSPTAAGILQNFLGSSIEERQVTAQRLSAIPAAQQYLGLMQQVAGSCNGF
jgi:hemophore-related protein